MLVKDKVFCFFFFYDFDAGYWFFCLQGYSNSTDCEFNLYVKNNSVKVVN